MGVVDRARRGSSPSPRRWRGSRHAEAEGWDGIFVWITLEPHRWEPFADPWITLAASRCHGAGAHRDDGHGVAETPAAGLAEQATTPHRLSKGRFTLGLGLGVDSYGEFSVFDEPMTDDRAPGRARPRHRAAVPGPPAQPVPPGRGRWTPGGGVQEPRLPDLGRRPAGARGGPRRAPATSSKVSHSSARSVGCADDVTHARTAGANRGAASRSIVVLVGGDHPDPHVLAAAGQRWAMPEIRTRLSCSDPATPGSSPGRSSAERDLRGSSRSLYGVFERLVDLETELDKLELSSPSCMQRVIRPRPENPAAASPAAPGRRRVPGVPQDRAELAETERDACRRDTQKQVASATRDKRQSSKVWNSDPVQHGARGRGGRQHAASAAGTKVADAASTAGSRWPTRSGATTPPSRPSPPPTEPRRRSAASPAHRRRPAGRRSTPRRGETPGPALTLADGSTTYGASPSGCRAPTRRSCATP